jgi:serine/threonine protein kinase
VSFLTDATLEHLKTVAAWPEFTSDRYEVLEEIGRGGMGRVYAARDTALKRDVAIKVGNAAAPAMTPSERLTREARLIAALEHPAIVPVHDCGLLADGRPFYVMKRLHGQTMQAYIAAEPALGERLRVFERVCEAAAFAHARGIIHRDLKPDNVMVGAFGEVMVMDFGIAAHRADVEPGVVQGTRGFMAPEQEAGAGDVDQRADVYALGAMLAALLPAGAPAPLRSISARASARAREDRYDSVEALAADIQRFRDGDAVRAHRENLVELTARFTRNYQVPILLVLAYIIMRAIVALVTR